MPLHIDPAWEYLAVPPEVLEAVYLNGPRLSNGARASFGWGEDAMPGMRTGSGNPNFHRCHLAPAKLRHLQPVAGLEWRRCLKCGQWFEPARQRQRYCGAACRPHLGRPRVLPEEVKCLRCGQGFRPRTSDQRCCSVSCAGGLGGNPSRVDLSVLAQLRQRGLTQREAAATLGISLTQCKRLCKRILSFQGEGEGDGKL